MCSSLALKKSKKGRSGGIQKDNLVEGMEVKRVDERTEGVAGKRRERCKKCGEAEWPGESREEDLEEGTEWGTREEREPAGYN